MQETSILTETFRTATAHKPTNQQDNKANAWVAIVQGHPNKTADEPTEPRSNKKSRTALQ
jgi:DNA gyrase inhibitor GyrI